MALSPEKRKRLREILQGVSTPEELKQLEDKGVMPKASYDLNRLGEAMQLLLEDKDYVSREGIKTRERTATMEANMMKGFMEVAAAVVTKLDEVKGYVGSQGQGDYALTMQNMAKSLAEGFASVKKSIDDKPVPVWRWPQYLYSGIRDTQFNPINPSIAAFAITAEYNDIELEYTGSNLTKVTYIMNFPGNGDDPATTRTVAVLDLTYDGSDNLTEVVRSQ